MIEKQKYAKLFNDYEFLTKDHLDLFIQTMDDELSIHCLISAVKTAYERGAFTIGEVELISKSIRVLAEPKEKSKNESE